ncbi:MAG TPA: hypothetical protein DDW23_05445 [Planctomycetes bacterium]|nr:hypothetical protein [Planctomycetota bacterium]|tara:strand:+ start:44 stop:517 length:474 start_codon:yes stop_codon:yes gene_type:complete
MAVIRTMNRGFSLAEILLVLAITGSMAALAIPVLAERDVVGSEVRRVLADSIRARARARAGWEASVLRIDPALNRWRPEQADGVPLPGPGANSAGWRNLRHGVSFEVLLGSEPIWVFLPDGKTISPAGIRLVKGDNSWFIKAAHLSGTLEAAPEEEK